MTVATPIMKSRQRKPRADHPYCAKSYEAVQARKAAIAAAKARREAIK